MLVLSKFIHKFATGNSKNYHPMLKDFQKNSFLLQMRTFSWYLIIQMQILTILCTTTLNTKLI